MGFALTCYAIAVLFAGNKNVYAHHVQLDHKCIHNLFLDLTDCFHLKYANHDGCQFLSALMICMLFFLFKHLMANSNKQSYT